MPDRAARRADVDECYDLARRVFAEIHRNTSPHWLSLDLTMGQMKALMMLTAHGAQPVGELGRRLGISEPAASLLADRLEADGLASRERDPDDRRRTLVTPTPAAAELATTLRQGREEQVRRWMAALTPAELDGLTLGLRGILHAATQRDASAGETASDAGGGEIDDG